MSYYQKMVAAPHVVIDQHEHFIKQTYRNRCLIAAPDGVQALTVPIVRNDPSHTAMRDIQISPHGNWQHLHWHAFVTAYDGSPYFEYYADDFRPFYERPFKFLLDFNEGLRLLLCELLDIQPSVQLSEAYQSGSGTSDFRSSLTPKQPDPDFLPRRYYQVFAQRNGFLPNLSVVDLLFNMGPESVLWLR